MAILKHINVHNSNYHDFITYVLFQHDNHARPIYNERHKMILRENVLIDAINTTPWSYNIDCQISNRQYKKNRDPRDIKSHHFILSFDPKDAECGLTLEKAQALGMEFAQKHFSGHQCVIATHD
ncbi:MAG: relaxase/mobilization nuclease domain-containing protein, partial [Oscillospiraceae bacterium]|nr:relaxase/mobilization nuclease domain-containing protein [Oscillospiraceae bacterium]